MLINYSGCQESCDLLVFQVDLLFQFMVLPFGLAYSPHLFIIVMQVVVAFLCWVCAYMLIFFYLDDIHILAPMDRRVDNSDMIVGRLHKGS